MAAVRLAPLTHDDREQIKRVLLESDDETRRRLGPLLVLEPVQHLLLSFVRDPSRSFEDHVWDPVTQDVLSRLRNAGIDPSECHAQTTSIFEAALLQKTQDGSAAVDMQSDIEAELLAKVDTAQADGKMKFQRGDHYAAMNAFKKSVLALLDYHEDQNYGKAIDPQEWEEDDLRQRYVTLCCNVAVCAIKLRNCAMIRLYAMKALRVDEQSRKAIYALAKVNLLEQRFDESRVEAAKGQKLYPENDQFANLLEEIAALERKQLEDRVDMLAVKELTEKVEGEAQKHREKEAAEQRAKLDRVAEVSPLPLLGVDELPFQHLNTYFMRIKQHLDVNIVPLHNPDNGEPPLFECNMLNKSTGFPLATGVTASSKKVAKQTAARVAIKTLWETKHDAGKLLPEEQERWQKYELAQRDRTALPPEASPKRADDESIVVPHQTNAPVQLTIYERATEPTSLLHQLDSKRQLRVAFNFEDVAPSKSEPLFKCTCIVNGHELAAATAPGKKKAKAEAARQAINAAVAKGMIQFVRTVTVVDDPSASVESGPSVVAAEVA